MSAAPPPGAFAAAAAHAVIAVASAPLYLPPSVAVVVAATECLEQALLLGSLLTQCLKHLLHPVIAIAARSRARAATRAAALPPPSASHGRCGGVVRSNEPGGGSHPQ